MASVDATFEYLQWKPLYETEKPYEIFIDHPAKLKGVERTNLTFREQHHTVTDVRGREHTFSLNGHGFTWRSLLDPSPSHDFSDEQAIESGYLPQIEQLLRREVEDVDLIKFFDFRLRTSQDDSVFARRTIDLNSKIEPLRPARYPHVDQSIDGAIKRCYYHMGAEADKLLRGRFRIINVWRPLDVVEDWPLALCDARSVTRADLVESDFVRRKYTGETYWALHNPEHKWFYLSNQRPEEVALLKIYDSQDEVEAKFCVHASFKLYNEMPTKPRRSIEVRALVFTYSGDHTSPAEFDFTRVP